MADRLGLGEAVSMALGGMIGGGIYAVLGVVASATAVVALEPLYFEREASREGFRLDRYRT